MQMKRFVAPAIIASFLATPLIAQDSTMLVLDAAGSMWGQIEGTAKITITQDTIGTLLNDLDTGRELGLMAYGHRRKGDCVEIEVLVKQDRIRSVTSPLKWLVSLLKAKRLWLQLLPKRQTQCAISKIKLRWY